MTDYRDHPNERIRAQVLAQLGETDKPAPHRRRPAPHDGSSYPIPDRRIPYMVLARLDRTGSAPWRCRVVELSPLP